jgi:hypothetical protein
MDADTVALIARVYGEQSARIAFDNMTTPDDKGLLALRESELATLLEIAFARGHAEGSATK